MLAAFARSDAGRTYGRVCEVWGVDPAAGFEDEVLAFNLRLALLVSMNEQEPEPEMDGVERARRAGEQIRRGV